MPSAFKFALDIEAQIEATQPNEYRMRIGRVSTLIEELYPLSRFALWLKQPGLGVEVEVFEKIGKIDAYITLSGFVDRRFAVEVTYAGYGYEEAMRDELMTKQGFAPGSGPISRDPRTKDIMAEVAAEDVDVPILRLAESIHDRVLAKAAKGYPAGTVLLVAFEDFYIRGRGQWAKLYSGLDSIWNMDSGHFAQIFLFNRFSNELQQAA